jgi:CheY-like chemotaxis protein
MAMPQLSGAAGAMAAYTEEEWNAQVQASWTRSGDGQWRWCGTRTPLGMLASLEVAEVPRLHRAERPRQLRTVLLVDDEARFVTNLQRAMKPFAGRWATMVAGSGQQALQLLARADFAAVIADRRMPLMDGLPLLREVARLYPQLGRLLLTSSARSRPDDVAHRVLRKPTSPAVVVDTLEAVMQELHGGAGGPGA